MKFYKVINWATLGILLIATYFSFYWIWGALFLFWSIRSLQQNEIFLLSMIQKNGDALLYWSVTLLWGIFGFWYLFYDLLWRFEIHTIFGYALYGT